VLCTLVVEAVDVNWQSFDGKTALLLAATEGHFTCTQILLQHGADVNLSDHMQETPLLAGRVILLICVSQIADVERGSIFHRKSHVMFQLPIFHHHH